MRPLFLLLAIASLALLSLPMVAVATLPQDLDPIGYWPHGDCGHVDVAGTIAYFALNHTLMAVDFSDPAYPNLVFMMRMPRRVEGIEVRPPYLHVIDTNDYHCIDVASPRTPSVLGTLATGQNLCLDASLDLAYVVDATDMLHVIRYDEFLGLAELGSFDYSNRGQPQAIAVAGDHAYLGSFYGLEVVDVSNPTMIHEAAWYPTPPSITALSIDGQYIHMALHSANSYMDRLNIASPDFPFWEGTFVVGSGIQEAIVAIYPHVYFGLGDVYVLRHFAGPDFEQIGLFDIDNYVTDLSWSHSRLYAATFDTGLRVIDVRDPTTPTEMGFFEVSSNSLDITRLGDHFYYASNDGVWAMDVSDPFNPVASRTSVDIGYVVSVEAVNGHLVATSGSMGIAVLEVSDPMAPTVVTYVPSAVTLSDLAVAGDYVYMMDPWTLTVMDMTTPASPIVRGSMSLPVGHKIDVSDQVGYVAVTGVSGGAGVQIINLEDPDAPVELGLWTTFTEPKAIAAYNGFAFLGTDSDGVIIVDARTPPAAVEVARFPVSSVVRDLDLNGIYLLVAAKELRAINVQRPDVPWEVAVSDEAYYLNSVYADDQLLACGGSSGFWTFSNQVGVGVEDQPRSRDSARLLAAYPNPFNPSTTIRYAVPAAGHVELEVFDVGGRHVSTLVSDHISSGEHQVQWNGKDDAGDRVASGVYLYQLRAGDFVETKRMVLLK